MIFAYNVEETLYSQRGKKYPKYKEMTWARVKSANMLSQIMLIGQPVITYNNTFNPLFKLHIYNNRSLQLAFCLEGNASVGCF